MTGPRSARTLVTVCAVLLMLSSCSPGLFTDSTRPVSAPSDAPARAPAGGLVETTGKPLYAAPKGSGSACSSRSPCEIGVAVSRASSGTAIKLASGSYGDVILKGHKNLDKVSRNAVLQPVSPRARPTFARLDAHTPHLTYTGVTVTSAWYLRARAVGSRIVNSHVDGGGVFLRSRDITITGSLFENGSSLDGIQVGGARNALIEDNIIRNYDQDRDNGLHADCIQVFESHDIVIRRNRISNCYNAGLIFSVGGGDGMSNIVVEANFIQSCVVKNARCRGGSAADLRERTASDVTIRHNTFANGSLRVARVPRLVFDRNIVEYMAACDSPITNSIITKWNVGLCEAPRIASTNGNRVSTVKYVNQAAGDLRLADPDTAAIRPTGAKRPSQVIGADGAVLDPNIAGASR